MQGGWVQGRTSNAVAAAFAALLLAAVFAPAASAQGPSVAPSASYVVEGGQVTLTYSGLSVGQAVKVTNPRGTVFQATTTGASGSLVFPSSFPGAAIAWAGTYAVQAGAAVTQFQAGFAAGGAALVKGTEVTARGAGFAASIPVTLRLLGPDGHPVPGLSGPLADGVLAQSDAQGATSLAVRLPHDVDNGTYTLEWVAGAASPAKAEPDRWLVELRPAQVTPTLRSAPSASSVARLTAVDYQVLLPYGDATHGDEFPGGLRARVTYAGGSTADLAGAPLAGEPEAFGIRFEPGREAPLGAATVRILDQKDRYGNHIAERTLGTIEVTGTQLTPHLVGSALPAARMQGRSFELTYTYPGGAAGRTTDVSPAVQLLRDGAPLATCQAVSAVCTLTPLSDGAHWNVTFTAPRDMPLGALSLAVPAGADSHGNPIGSAASPAVSVVPATLRLGFQHASPNGVTDAYLRGDTIQAQGTISYPNGEEVAPTDIVDPGHADLFITRSDGTVRSAPITPSNGLWQGSFEVLSIDPAGPATLHFTARDRWGNLGATNTSTVLGLAIGVDVLPTRAIAAVARGEPIDATATVRGPNGAAVPLGSAPLASLWSAGVEVAAGKAMESLGNGRYGVSFPTRLSDATGAYQVRVAAASGAGEPGLGIGEVEVRASALYVSGLNLTQQLVERGQTTVARFNVSALTGAAVAPDETSPSAHVDRVAIVNGTANLTFVAALEVQRGADGWTAAWTPGPGQALGTYQLAVDGTDAHGNVILGDRRTVEVIAGPIAFARFAVDRTAYSRLDSALLTVEARDPDGKPIDLADRKAQLLRPNGESVELPLKSLGNGTYQAQYRFALRDPLTSSAQAGYRFRLPAGAFADAAGNAGPANDLVTPYLGLSGTVIAVLPDANQSFALATPLSLRFAARYLDGSAVPTELGPPAVTWVTVVAGNRSYAVDQVRLDAASGLWVATWTPPARLGGAVHFAVGGTDAAGNRVLAWDSPSIALAATSLKERDSPLPVGAALALLLLALAAVRRRA